MADDLVERLEARCDHTEWDYLCVEAANRITALQAQNRKLIEAARPFAERSDWYASDFIRLRTVLAEADKGVG